MKYLLHFFFKWQDNLNNIVKSFLVICTRNNSFKLTLSKRLINRNRTFLQFYQTLNCDFQNRDSKTLSLKSLFLKTLFFKQLPKRTLNGPPLTSLALSQEPYWSVDTLISPLLRRPSTHSLPLWSILPHQ